MDSRHRRIRLFLRFYHIKHEHQSVDYLCSVIHQQFVVLRLRSALRAIETHWVCCRKQKAKTVTPMMSDLPAERLVYRQPPFSNCSVHYFGPFHVTIRRSSEKRWGFLFTCLTTGGIHIDLAPSINYGKGNNARSANLWTVSGNYTRPLVKLVPILAPSGVEDNNGT